MPNDMYVDSDGSKWYAAAENRPAGVTEAQPQILQELDLNYKILTELEGAIRELESRLNLVLLPAAPVNPQEKDKVNNRVPLAETLHNQGQLIVNLTQAVSSIIKRIEL